MDEQNNPTAQYFAGLMEQADTDRKVGIANRLNEARATATGVETKPVPEVDLSSRSSPEPAAKTDTKTATNSVTDTSQADKLELAQSGNDFSVATLSSLANRKGQFRQIGPNEGVLNLH
jgi:hypothetical protein